METTRNLASSKLNLGVVSLCASTEEEHRTVAAGESEGKRVSPLDNAMKRVCTGGSTYASYDYLRLLATDQLTRAIEAGKQAHANMRDAAVDLGLLAWRTLLVNYSGVKRLSTQLTASCEQSQDSRHFEHAAWL